MIIFRKGVVILFGTILKNLRINKELTQGELAKELNVGQSTIAMWERGERVPKNIEMYEDIADFFNVNLSTLTGKSNNDDEQLQTLIEIFTSLNDDNRKKLLELARLYANSNNQ